ncbi:hypothetical protein HYALB_00006973 [Hymenoscyphus albidus]|uniref:Fe2OG dioxygenase domain-containing protein n=1 Tax=Hymenoscyphus albidus TaxID=595503 RepID=A0A9N9LJI8_9HELO|nr:hypothetical protein HYALB_00006973 [Hymenoscyphus albidus]
MATTQTRPKSQDPERRVANLAIINYEELLLQKPEEIEKLYLACAKWGFFYLDLSGDNTKDYLNNVDSLFAASKEYFAKSLEEKLGDKREELSIYNICRYKPMGSLGLDAGNATQKKNGSENLRVPVDLIHNPTLNPNLYFPTGMKKHEQQFASFIKSSHSVPNLIAKNLFDYLQLEGNNRFENFHKPNEQSTSSAVLQHYPLTDLPPQTSAGHFTHTDTGSITVLFNTEWRLQVFSPETEDWEYVPQRKDCAIINVGDTLKFISNFKLKSSLHRVIPWHGPNVSNSRYATIFFLRASNDVKFRDSEGVEWTGSGWLERKFENYRIPHEEQKKTAISTGKKGFVGLWDQQKQAVF